MRCATASPATRVTWSATVGASSPPSRSRARGQRHRGLARRQTEGANGELIIALAQVGAQGHVAAHAVLLGGEQRRLDARAQGAAVASSPCVSTEYSPGSAASTRKVRVAPMGEFEVDRRAFRKRSNDGRAASVSAETVGNGPTAAREAASKATVA